MEFQGTVGKRFYLSITSSTAFPDVAKKLDGMLAV